MAEPEILVACEHESDARVARGFAERILTERISWYADLSVDARPTWRGFEPMSSHLRWASIGDVYLAARLPPVFGFFDGQPQKVDAANALKALRLGEKAGVKIVVLMRDVDSADERIQGLVQGRAEYHRLSISRTPVTAVIGLPDRYREAWLLAGFLPKTPRENELLSQAIDSVAGVHPTQASHRLRDREGEPRCAKDVWKALSQNVQTREESCWTDTPLKALHLYGDGCGLKAYLEEIETHLVPLFSSGPKT